MLRFKRDDGTSYPEWEEKKIGDMGEIITGNTPSTQDLENYGDEFMFCSPADMGDNKYILKTTKMLSLKGFNVSRKLPKGSILVTCIGSTIGKIGIASKEMTSNQQINTIIPYNSFNNEFIYYALLKNFKKFLNVVSNQAVPILNKSQFEKLLILVPCLEEQQKIADFLSEVDNIIAMSEQEIESLEMQKKGAMQKIFSQEVRFKADDGSEYPEWEEKKIRDILEICHGKDYKLCKQIEKKYSVLGTGGIITYVDEFLCDWECVLIGRKGTIDKPMYMDKPFWSVDTLFFSKPKEKQNVKFQYYLFEDINWKKYNEASGVPSLSASTIENIKVHIPCMEEQQKIADFLSEFDNAIEYAKEELEVWKNIKKGLLQQMFE